MSKKQKLIGWLRKRTEGYPNVDVKNLNRSFSDGLAFCALVDSIDDSLLDFDKLSPSNPTKNLNLAFSLAEDQLRVPALLDAEDITDFEKPDDVIVMTYLIEFCKKYATAPIQGGRTEDVMMDMPTEEEINMYMKEKEAQRKRKQEMLERKQRKSKSRQSLSQIRSIPLNIQKQKQSSHRNTISVVRKTHPKKQKHANHPKQKSNHKKHTNKLSPPKKSSQSSRTSVSQHPKKSNSPALQKLPDQTKKMFSALKKMITPSQPQQKNQVRQAKQKKPKNTLPQAPKIQPQQTTRKSPPKFMTPVTYTKQEPPKNQGNLPPPPPIKKKTVVKKKQIKISSSQLASRTKSTTRRKLPPPPTLKKLAKSRQTELAEEYSPKNPRGYEEYGTYEDEEVYDGELDEVNIQHGIKKIGDNLNDESCTIL